MVLLPAFRCSQGWRFKASGTPSPFILNRRRGWLQNSGPADFITKWKQSHGNEVKFKSWIALVRPCHGHQMLCCSPYCRQCWDQRTEVVCILFLAERWRCWFLEGSEKEEGKGKESEGKWWRRSCKRSLAQRQMLWTASLVPSPRNKWNAFHATNTVAQLTVQIDDWFWLMIIWCFDFQLIPHLFQICYEFSQVLLQKLSIAYRVQVLRLSKRNRRDMPRLQWSCWGQCRRLCCGTCWPWSLMQSCALANSRKSLKTCSQSIPKLQTCYNHVTKRHPVERIQQIWCN